MSLLPARMKMIQSKMKGQHCSYYKSMFFLNTQGELTLQSMIGFWPNFELIRTLMGFLITCKNQEDPIKNEGAIVLRTNFSIISLRGFFQGQLTPQSLVRSGRFSELVRDVMR